MSRNWEDTFAAWSVGPSATEQTKAENAERAIKNAIAASPSLSSRNVQVFAQGSYRNRTNVRLDSDVDICVRLMDVFYYDLPDDLTKQDAGIAPAEYTYWQFKNDVGAALVAQFGSASVHRGDKAFDVHENSYRVDSDVVATFEHRRYHRMQWGGLDYYSGTEIRPDSGGRIVNWPQQNYDNGVAKHQTTSRRFKRTVRILKRLRNEMSENGVPAAEPIASYLIECLVWNVPNYLLNSGDSYTSTVRASLAHLIKNTGSDDDCREWGEENELKYLFRDAQPWTRDQVYRFVLAAWSYAGF